MRRRLIGGAALTAVGAGLMVWALAFGGGLQPLGGGVLAVFLGVALLAPVIGRPIVTVIAAPYRADLRHRRGAGPGERPAQPRRTAATASALMIGLALVTTMAVLGQSAKSSVDEADQHRPEGRLRGLQHLPVPVLRRDRRPDRGRARGGRPPPRSGSRRPPSTASRTSSPRSTPADYSRAVTLTLESGTLDHR